MNTSFNRGGHRHCRAIPIRPFRPQAWIPRLPALLAIAAAAFALTALTARQTGAQTKTDPVALKKLAKTFERRLQAGKTQLYRDLVASTDQAQRALNDDPSIQLMFIDRRGVPRFYQVNNLNAAQTISTDDVWPGGVTGYNLSGSGTTSSELAVWDGGGVRTTHQEFGGRVTQVDSPPSLHYHSTHVAGTLVAAGVDPAAKGMSYAAQLSAYDWNSDNVEMAAAAVAGLNVSSHSYGFATGWSWSSSSSVWYWYGDLGVSTSEDYGFGFYGIYAADWDSIAYNAPEYLIVKSAGNDRNDAGPGPGGGHYHWNGSWVWATDTHDADGNNGTGYDCVGWIGTAKNILTVGAILDIPGGYTTPADVVQTTFSSWGPCDDGRIKPDIVANGYQLYSPRETSDTAYLTISGTSMSTPNAAGSINLLVEDYETRYGKTPRSSTMKALVIQTADESGPADGPDYQNGWGLMNTSAAAAVIEADPNSVVGGIGEAEIANTVTDYYYFSLPTPRDARVTIAWTDPAGTPPAASVDPATSMLVNDLDLRLTNTDNGTVYFPWRLDRANPSVAATRGDNAVDNVERVDAASLPAGNYRVAVSHKGTLASSQWYSIAWSGLIPAQPPMQLSTSLIRGAILDLSPNAGAAPMAAGDDNQERGVFITALKDFQLTGLAMKMSLPCEGTIAVRVYEASGTTRGALIRGSGQFLFHAGDVYYYLPIDATLEACKEYYIACSFGATYRWYWWSEGTITEPFDVGGVIRVRDAALNGAAGNTALPQFSVVGYEISPRVASDLAPPTGAFGTCIDGTTERGVYITAEQTLTTGSLGFEADFSSTPVELTAKIYAASGLSRDSLIATGTANIAATGLQVHEVPISAVLEEGRDYDIVMEFPATTWSCISEASITLPYAVDGAIRVRDGEYAGNAGNTILTHFTVGWTPGVAGAPHDLGAPNGPYPPPATSVQSTFDYGAYIQAAANEELYSIGWSADVPEGELIGARVYKATGTTRGALISEGTILSSASGTRWHDIPVAASLIAGDQYDIEIDIGVVNSWRYWLDTLIPAPYTAYGAITVVNSEQAGNPANAALPWMRVNLCNPVASGAEGEPVRAPAFTLAAPYPNPVTGSSTIGYSMDRAGPLTIAVYDVAGRKVASLVERSDAPAGPGTAMFNASALPSGIYFVKMRSGMKSVARKITIVR